MYDIIGDVHGQAQKLTNLLTKLGYKNSDQGYFHPQYKAIFVGDLIDRGAYQLETLQIVKDMIDNQNALAVMGNHEFNALGWITPNQNQPNKFLREHNHVHFKQHKVFLEQLGSDNQQHQQWVNWMLSLPLFLDLPELRIVHACWDSKIVAGITPYLDDKNRLKPKYIQQVFNSDHPLFDYCEILLKGKETKLPEGVFYHDKDGNRRDKSRIKWWLPHAHTWNDWCMIPREQQTEVLNQAIDISIEPYHEDKPVLFGHYWFSGTPKILSDKLACVDYSAAIESGKLVAYRWQGESQLTNHGFIY